LCGPRQIKRIERNPAAAILQSTHIKERLENESGGWYKFLRSRHAQRVTPLTYQSSFLFFFMSGDYMYKVTPDKEKGKKIVRLRVMPHV
jgi:hypothetical protein